MRKFKSILFSVLCFAVTFVVTAEILGATQLFLGIRGTIQYTATEIGSDIFGTWSVNTGSTVGTVNYLTFSGEGGTTSNNVYTVTGKEDQYAGIDCNIGNVTFTDKTQSVEIFVVIKNVGEKYIIPAVEVTTGNSYLVVTQEEKYFDISNSGVSDPLTLKNNASTASAFASSLKSSISGNNCTAFQSNMSIDKTDSYMVKITIALDQSKTYSSGELSAATAFNVKVGFGADIQYTSNSILSVYQEQNSTSTAWTKYGINATYSATATKVEATSLDTLKAYLATGSKDSLGNANVKYGDGGANPDVYYTSAPVYKDIDIVNVDIATGEIIGKLSDPSYPFEWFGRSVELPSGTTLASGRTLTKLESFTVDCYTYYPTMYIRRWVVGNNTWMSVSDLPFEGAVKIDAFYTGTFEARMFNSDGTGAKNSYGAIPRSFVSTNGAGPVTSGSISYAVSNYGCTDSAGIASVSTTQENMQGWMNNLTKAWNASTLDSQYRQVKGVQGENWKMYVYDILYLVKYANNNSQTTVGYGATYNCSVTSDFYAAEKGGGTVTCYDSSSLSYGYSNSYQDGNTHNFNGNDPAGLYATQFLTYNWSENGTTTTKRILLDGYVGTDKYTGVFCLGRSNPWGNVWERGFGQAVIYDGTNLHAYINYADYNMDSPNWHFATDSNAYATKKSTLENKGYVELGYYLPKTTDIYCRYTGVSSLSTPHGYEQLIGLPISTSSTASDSTGLCDYYWCNATTSYNFGVLRGGGVYYKARAGLFYYDVICNLTYTSDSIGFRPSLISS